MHVAIMGRWLRPPVSGIGRYAANLICRLSEELPGCLSVFLPQGVRGGWKGKVCEVRAPFPTPSEALRAAWEQSVVPFQAKRVRVDVYHSPNHMLPLALTCPTVVTVHDLFYLDPALHRRRNQLYLSVMTSLALRRASAVIAASHYTRRALEARYPHTAGRVHVVYQGVDRALRRPSRAQLDAFRARSGLAAPFILSVGTLEPRKNHVRLITAFERLLQRASLPHHLVLAGATGWLTNALDQALSTSPYRDRIHCTGHTSDDELACWYAAADLFVYPSLKEGFGVPPLEAMTLGTPVVASNSTALPEVVGDAALTASPYDVDGLAEAMLAVLRDPALAERLRQAGLERARRFDWADAARQHVAIYREVLDRGAP